MCRRLDERRAKMKSLEQDHKLLMQNLAVKSGLKKRGNVPYGAGITGVTKADFAEEGIGSKPPGVWNNDELAHASRKDDRGEGNRSEEPPEPDHASSPDLWSKTSFTKGPPCALVSRFPQASQQCVQWTVANFRKLFATKCGLLLEDDKVAVYVSIKGVSL